VTVGNVGATGTGIETVTATGIIVPFVVTGVVRGLVRGLDRGRVLRIIIVAVTEDGVVAVIIIMAGVRTIVREVEEASPRAFRGFQPESPNRLQPWEGP
jgi:ascorbate-specific PTS system EIIC-type component UlaA